MSVTQSETIKLGTSSAIRVGPIVTAGSNETISIVIPLSAQVATLAGQSSGLDSCTDCGKNFTSVAEFSGGHRDQASIKGCPFPTCSRYGRAFSRAHDLKRHIARHEARRERLADPVNVQIHRCDICQQHFLSEVALRKHVESHERTIHHPYVERDRSPRSLDCSLCKKRYAREKQLETHLTSHDKKQVLSKICALCGARFSETNELQVHTKTHIVASSLEPQAALNNSKSSPQFEVMEFVKKDENNAEVAALASRAATASDKIRCDYCWKTFKSKWTLNSHVAAHEGRYQFDCDQCGKRFVRKSHFEGHVQSHEATRPYACEICGHTFKQAKHRREHVKRKHPGSQNAVQNLLDSMSTCVSEESSVDQPEFTLLMPVDLNA